MKKTVITLAVVAFAAAAVQATTTSANIVGYTKITATGGELSLVALNFTPGSTLVSDIIGDQLPSGSALHIWDKVNQTYNTVTKTSRGGWGNTATIDLGNAFWIQASGTDTHEIILPGEVKTDALSTTIAGGIEATGYNYPVSTTFGSTDLSSSLDAGSAVHFWNGSSYTTYTKTSRGGWGTDGNAQVIEPTTGFWVQSASEVSWSESVPF